VVSASNKTLAVVRHGATRMVINTHEMMTGDFTRRPDLRFPAESLRQNIQAAAGGQLAEFVDATRLATAIHGDAIAANMFMLGYAYQRGLIPVSAEAISQAIALNGAAVKMNQEAFLWGRRAAHDLKTVDALTARNQRGTAASQHKLSASVEELMATREQFLTEYQNAGYAARYVALVNSVRDWESKRFSGKSQIAEAVARHYFKLMAYKDEYEVARLQSDPKFMEELKQQFEGDFRISFNLAPPGIAPKDPRSGESRKKEFGSWMLPVLRVLAGLRFLRGTPLDPFGHTAERRTERDLIQKYEQTVALILEKTTPAHYETAVRLASVPELIRGYGHVKHASLQQAEAAWSEAAQQLQQPAVIELHRAA